MFLFFFLISLSPGASAGQPKRVTFVSVNDVYKLVGLPSELPYFYMQEDFQYISDTASVHCDGKTCSSDLAKCGEGSSWEACFPLSFNRTKEFSAKKPMANEGVRVSAGPCEVSQGASAHLPDKYGGLLDFAATFKWLKEEAVAAGHIAVGTFAGDFIGPSFLAETFKGKQLVEVMNHMGVDLANIGNHDVDFKLASLQAQMHKSAFHYLNANLEDASGAQIQQPMLSEKHVQGNDYAHESSEWRRLSDTDGSRFGKGWAMLQKAGIRICVLGTTDIDKMNWPGKKVKGVDRDIPAAIGIMKFWEREELGCSIRVAMTHTRTGNDLNLFQAVEHAGLHLDAIIAGHDHYAAFAELKRSDNGTTYLVKTGADARLVSKLTFDLSGNQPRGRLEIVPVRSGSCKLRGKGADRGAWFRKTEDLFKKYVAKASEADAIPLSVFYKGVYDTNVVRDAESRAVNFWLDTMRESVSGDILFFQAGLVRQDMYQVFHSEVSLSQLFMLEEFPWGDEDLDARSSLFPFKVSVKELLTKTLPFVARKYWCRAPFNDANRIHVSGLIVEMINKEGCDSPTGPNPIQSVSFVGNCHQKGALQGMGTGCCVSPLCGQLWSHGDWSPRMTETMKTADLIVVTGQFCVPSKYGSHGPGFHEAGMLCARAEAKENWGSGASFSRDFAGRGVMDDSASAVAAPDFPRFGYFFKPAMLQMLRSQPSPMHVGSEGLDECHSAAASYQSASFFHHCVCEMRVPNQTGCSRKGQFNGFPRFYADHPQAFSQREDPANCSGESATCRLQVT